MFRHRILTSSAVLAVLASAITMAPTAAAPGGSGTRMISAGGTTSIRATGSGSAALAQPEIRTGIGDTAGAGTGSVAGVPVVGGPSRSDSAQNGGKSGDGESAGDQGVNGALSIVNSFLGLNHRNQRTANNANQYSVEPPDQGLCVGNGYVLETVNDVMNVYSSAGHSLKGVTDLNSFYGYAPQVIRSPRADGPFVTDPSCYFDKATQRWFHVALTLDVKPAPPHSGALLGSNHLDIAVSQTASPLGLWSIYRISVQDDGTMGTPNHHCTGAANTIRTNPFACIGDYPHIGADANGFYITTNEYSLFGPEFHGAQLYALSKRALAHNASSVAVTQISTQGLDNGNSGFTIWPAVAPADQYATANRGTEYFLSSNAADEAHGDGTAIGPRTSKQLLVWSLTNTKSLDSSPAIQLSHSVLKVGRYAFPPPSEQKVGSTPLRDCLNDADCATNFVLGFPDPFAPNPEYALDSNDTRMQQVVYANGKIWGALDTALKVGGKVQAGIEWFVVQPSGEEDNGAELVNQGYLAVKGNNVIYPAVGVTPSGRGVIAFTLVGHDHFPSAAFASINAGGVGPVQVAAEGLGPADGFSGYAIFNDPNPNRPRWGDYGAAVVDGGDIWIASEYIAQTCTLDTYLATGGSCGATRTALGNWATRITRVHVDEGGNNN